MTQHVSLHLTAEALDFLNRLAPSQNRRGRYVSELIMQAAQEAGLTEAPSPKTLEDRVAVLEQQVAGLLEPKE